MLACWLAGITRGTLIAGQLLLHDHACYLTAPANRQPGVIFPAGEPGGDMFILMRGELLQLDVDGSTMLAKIPEGSVFGETVVLRNLEVGGDTCA